MSKILEINGARYKIGLRGKVYRWSDTYSEWVLSGMTPTEFSAHRSSGKQSIEKTPDRRRGRANK